MNTAIKLAQIAQANHVTKTPLSSFEKKRVWEAHQYVRYVVKEATERASKGFGSVRITIDKTSDLFGVDEKRNSCYSSEFVCQLLSQKGFRFDHEEYEDHYDAFSTNIIWDDSLPKSPVRIGMCWK